MDIAFASSWQAGHFASAIRKFILAFALNGVRDGFTEVNGQRVSPDVARLRPVGIGENSLDRLKDRGPGFTVAKVIKHHRTAPDLSDRVGNAFASDVRSASVNGFEHAGKFTFRVEVSRGSVADGAGYRRTKITEYVAEEVGCDNDINPVGWRTKCAVRMSMWNWSTFTPGYSLAMAVTVRPNTAW